MVAARGRLNFRDVRSGKIWHDWHPCVGGLQRSAQPYLGILNKNWNWSISAESDLNVMCDSGEVLCVQVGGIR